jgi:DNA-binding transcriptional LysR family regulator
MREKAGFEAAHGHHAAKNQCQKGTSSSAPLPSGLQAGRQSHLPMSLLTDKVRGKFRYKMVKRVVELEAGIAILPETTVRSELASLVLCGVPFENGGHTEPLAVIYRRRKKLTPAMENFIATLKQP